MATSPVTPDDHEVVVPRALLERAERALWEVSKAALTVAPSLYDPYPDDPRWSPWTRWMKRPAKEAHNTCMALRQLLKKGR